jgi:O-acetyl-ADP-ribose deacetylase (regulator of RNase III)
MDRNPNPIAIMQGDITRLRVDAIVNAANNSLLGGGGVDGAIHRGAGPALLAECRTLGGCPTGSARLTHGYSLPAKWVIHTVGPIWQGGDSGEDELLARCYRNCLRLAMEHGFETIAFPSISTGAYGFPLDRACRIALREISDFFGESATSSKVTIVCFDVLTFRKYVEVLAEIRLTEETSRSEAADTRPAGRAIPKE